MMKKSIKQYIAAENINSLHKIKKSYACMKCDNE